MGRLGHTGCHPGKRVMVKLHSGQTIIGRFKDRSKKYVFLEDGTKIHKMDIRVFSIFNERLAREQHGV